MKRPSILCGIALILTLIADTAYAQSFGFDMDGDGTPGDTETSIYQSDTIEVDIYLTGWGTTNFFGADWYFRWDTTSLDVVSYTYDDTVYDDCTFYLNDELAMSMYKDAPGVPGPDIKLITVVLHCKTAPSNDWIRATLSPDGIAADVNGTPVSPSDGEGTIHQVECTTTSTESTTTGQITISSTTSTSSTTITNTTTVPKTTIHSSSTTTTIDDRPWWCPFEEIYGEGSEETELLRYFRDDILSKTPEGKEIIRLFYEWSPATVRAMEEDEEFKKELKAITDEILLLIRAEVR